MSRETFQSLRMLLMEKLDLARELTDEEILEEIDTLILERMRDSCLSLKEKVQLRQELFHSVRKLDVLQELIEDETVTEIMVNGPDAIFVERAGKLSRWEKTFTSGEKLEQLAVTLLQIVLSLKVFTFLHLLLKFLIKLLKILQQIGRAHV